VGIYHGPRHADPIASFDCNKAKTHVEKLVCSNDTLSLLDSKLTGLYKLSLNVIKPKQSLIKQQTNWLKSIRGNCNDINCISRAYSERIDEISNNLSKHTKPIPRSVVAEKIYPPSKSPNSYCRFTDGGGSYFLIKLTVVVHLYPAI
jgi:uncharacterized protein